MPRPIDRAALLEEMRADNTGWPSIDVTTLLESWDFVPTPLDHSRRGEARTLWRHPSDPIRLSVVIYSADPLPARIVLDVVDMIDDLGPG